jgi:NAD(P)-dependent dehydrogenase (short-subunit alcohol dehydrogenase family)
MTQGQFRILWVKKEMYMANDLSGKVAIVTGAVSKMGIGFAVARQLAECGAHVAVVDKYRIHPRSMEEDKIEGWRGLDSVVEEIESLGRQGLAIVADVTQGQQVKQMADRVIDKFGHIDILVNNAGILGPRSPVLEYSEKAWREVLAVNLIGPFLCSKEVAGKMIASNKNGKIINIASEAGKLPNPPTVAYSASKAGLINLTQTLALELAPHHINVNALCPGSTVSELSRGSNIRKQARELGISVEESTARVYSELLPILPLGLARPADQANAVAFLASSDADHITGIALNVTGGRLMAP